MRSFLKFTSIENRVVTFSFTGIRLDFTAPFNSPQFQHDFNTVLFELAKRINTPYVDEPWQRIYFNPSTDSPTSPSNIVFRPNHGVDHSVRQLQLLSYYLRVVAQNGHPIFVETINQLTTQELACLSLAAFCFRVGRTNEKPHTIDTLYAKHSAAIFKCVAASCGFEPSLANSIAKMIHIHMETHEWDVDKIDTYPEIKEINRGFDPKSRHLAQHKAMLSKLLLDLSHHTDLVRCTLQTQLVQRPIAHALTTLLSRTQDQVSQITQDALFFAIYLCQITGANVYILDAKDDAGNPISCFKRPNPTKMLMVATKPLHYTANPITLTHEIKQLYDDHINLLPPPIKVLHEPAIVKTIGAGLNDFWGVFVNGLVWGKKTPLRNSTRKHYTVRLTGSGDKAYYEIVKNSLKRPLHHDKAGFTKHQSTTFISPRNDYLPPVFGENSRINRLVGMRFPLSHILLQRIMLSDGWTTERPYDFDTREEAESWIKEQIAVDFYHTTLQSLEEKGKEHQFHYNEVMCRLKISLEGMTQIVIFLNNDHSRMLALWRQLDLLMNLKEKDKSARVANIPISFYPNCAYYTTEDQQADLNRILSAPDKQVVPVVKNLATLIVSVKNDYYAPNKQKNILVSVLKSGSQLAAKKIFRKLRNSPIISGQRAELACFIEAAAAGGHTIVLNALLNIAQQRGSRVIEFFIHQPGKSEYDSGLILAAQNGHTSIVDTILTHCAPEAICQADSHRRDLALRTAILFGRLGIVKLLLKRDYLNQHLMQKALVYLGCLLPGSTYEYGYPLALAVKSKYDELVKLILRKHEVLNSYSAPLVLFNIMRSGLTLAYQQESSSMVKIIIQHCQNYHPNLSEEILLPAPFKQVLYSGNISIIQSFLHGLPIPGAEKAFEAVLFNYNFLKVPLNKHRGSFETTTNRLEVFNFIVQLYREHDTPKNRLLANTLQKDNSRVKQYAEELNDPEILTVVNELYQSALGSPVTARLRTGGLFDSRSQTATPQQRELLESKSAATLT